ncbi:hypothetical protein [Niveispirillum sp. BGYR6]|uniref:hypothetical protein n=1 Tax=Niveispirillum sp. BGYR6 TaxID=2971249 RepID=UPI0022B9BB6C|nr:hypothetical protein [Niveispirillum sp. BGYR6]MDG5495740.1 hypothetical protein [Niveispirillum sp. BGYR6]
MNIIKRIEVSMLGMAADLYLPEISHFLGKNYSNNVYAIGYIIGNESISFAFNFLSLINILKKIINNQKDHHSSFYVDDSEFFVICDRENDKLKFSIELSGIVVSEKVVDFVVSVEEINALHVVVQEILGSSE